MDHSEQEAPALVAYIAWAHLAYGLLVLSLPWWNEDGAVIQPLLLMSWAGTTAGMLLLAWGVRGEGWPPKGVWWLASLLVFDAAGLGLLLMWWAR